jgi:hypothetical protein
VLLEFDLDDPWSWLFAGQRSAWAVGTLGSNGQEALSWVTANVRDMDGSFA